MTYDDAIRVLLEGVTGANVVEVARRADLAPGAVGRFLRREVATKSETRDAIATVVWRSLNAHVLLSDEDRTPGS